MILFYAAPVYDWAQKEKCTDMLLSRHVDALIFIGSNFIDKADEKNDYLYRAAAQIPVIIVNGYLKGDHIYSVLCDDVDASWSGRFPFLCQRRQTSSVSDPLFFLQRNQKTGRF